MPAVAAPARHGRAAPLHRGDGPRFRRARLKDHTSAARRLGSVLELILTTVVLGVVLATVVAAIIGAIVLALQRALGA